MLAGVSLAAQTTGQLPADLEGLVAGHPGPVLLCPVGAEAAEAVAAAFPDRARWPQAPLAEGFAPAAVDAAREQAGGLSCAVVVARVEGAYALETSGDCAAAPLAGGAVAAAVAPAPPPLAEARAAEAPPTLAEARAAEPIDWEARRADYERARLRFRDTSSPGPGRPAWFVVNGLGVPTDTRGLASRGGDEDTLARLDREAREAQLRSRVALITGLSLLALSPTPLFFAESGRGAYNQDLLWTGVFIGVSGGALAALSPITRDEMGRRHQQPALNYKRREAELLVDKANRDAYLGLGLEGAPAPAPAPEPVAPAPAAEPAAAPADAAPAPSPEDPPDDVPPGDPAPATPPTGAPAPAAAPPAPLPDPSADELPEAGEAAPAPAPPPGPAAPTDATDVPDGAGRPPSDR